MARSVDYLIVGAGFAGAVCAERLASAGKSVLLIDKRDHVGGNAHDYYNEDGILVHKYGAHVFHTNSLGVIEYLSKFTGWRPYEHQVRSSVNGHLLPVPINDTTLAAFGGDLAAAEAAMVTPYTRKQWGAHADALLPGVKARIKPRAGTDDRYFTDTYQVMPAHGYHRLFERLLDHPKIQVWLNCDWACCEYRDYGALIWTGAIDEYFGHRFGRLPYRSARFEHITYDVGRFQPVGVVNHPSPLVPFTRVCEFKHLTGQDHPQTTIAVEYPQADGDPFWPVPTPASAALYQRYAALAAETPHVHFVGRLGRYQYLNIDQVVAQALTLSKKLLQEESCPVQ